jgi:hypothetical protein
MVERYCPKTPLAPAAQPVPKISLFAPPQLLADEDPAGYDELLGRLHAAVKPGDIIDEMFIADVASLEWDALRWRRWKASLIRECKLKALEDFVREKLDYSDYLADDLATILEDNFPGEAQTGVETLARQYVRHEADAIDKIDELLAPTDLYVFSIANDAKAKKAKDLAQAYARREPEAVKQVNEFLADSGQTLDGLTTAGLTNSVQSFGPINYLNAIERIDRLATVAESRRNATLREIDRRRASLGHDLRRGIREVEEGEFQVVEPGSTKGKTAA